VPKAFEIEVARTIYNISDFNYWYCLACFARSPL